MNEIEQISAFNTMFQDALREGDGEKCASLCADNAVMMPPNETPVEGRDAIRRHFADLGPDPSVGGEILETRVSGQLAYQRSRVSWDSNGKTKYTDSLDILRQQDDGSWLYVACAWNSAEGLDQE